MACKCSFLVQVLIKHDAHLIHFQFLVVGGNNGGGGIRKTNGRGHTARSG